MSDSAPTQEDLDEQAVRLEDMRAEIRRLDADRASNQATVDLEVTKQKLDDEEARLSAQLAESQKNADIEYIRQGAPTLAERKDEMERQLALKAAAEEAEAAKATPKAHAAKGGAKAHGSSETPDPAADDDKKGE